MRRRLTAVLTTVAALAILSGCSSTGTSSSTATTHTGSSSSATTHTGSSGGGTLRITAYSGIWETALNTDFVKPFEQATGVHVEISLGTDSTWMNSLEATKGVNPQYDLAALEGNDLAIGYKDHILLPIDTAKIKNWSELIPAQYGPKSGLVYGGKIYAVPFATGQLGLAYNTDKIKDPPKSWSDLINNPKYRGHIALSPPSDPAEGVALIAGLVKARGGSLTNENDVHAAIDSLKALKGAVVAFPSDNGTIQNLLTSGDVWICPFLDGRSFALQKAGQPIGFVYPSEGAVAGVTSWAIPKGGHTKLAYEFLNYLTNAEAQGKWGSTIFYAMSNANAVYSSYAQTRVKTGKKYFQGVIFPPFQTITKDIPQWQVWFNAAVQ